jgi:hypothetical protein
MPVAIIKGTATSFGILVGETTAGMVATNVSVSSSSNKVEAKNISGGTAAVAYVGKKDEYSLEGYITATNSVTQGGVVTPSSTGLVNFSAITGSCIVEEITYTKSSEDFAKLKYKIVARDGI